MQQREREGERGGGGRAWHVLLRVLTSLSVEVRWALGVRVKAHEAVCFLRKNVDIRLLMGEDRGDSVTFQLGGPF